VNVRDCDKGALDESTATQGDFMDCQTEKSPLGRRGVAQERTSAMNPILHSDHLIIRALQARFEEIRGCGTDAQQ
jgi:hypothetical protein